MTTTQLIGTYRMPRNGNQPSVVLTARATATGYVFAGAATGPHTVEGLDPARARAHWQGYVSNAMGRPVKPAALKFPEAAAPPVAAAQACDLDNGWPECWNRQCPKHTLAGGGR